MFLKRSTMKAAAALVAVGWKFSPNPLAAASEHGTGQEYRADEGSYVVRTDPVSVTACGSSVTPKPFVFHDLWQMAGNPGDGQYIGAQWTEVGTSYCDQYGMSAKYVYARQTSGGNYFEYALPEVFLSQSTKFKINRGSTSGSGAYYTAQIITPSVGRTINAGTMLSTNEQQGTFGNWAQVGLEVQDRPNSIVQETGYTDLAGRNQGSWESWAGRDGCFQTGDKSRGWWHTDTHFKTKRDGNVGDC